MFRRRIYDIVEGNPSEHKAAKAYDAAMLLAIVLGVFPLMFRHRWAWFDSCEVIAAAMFSVDYVLRWLTADMRRGTKRSMGAFLIYPFTPWAIIDLLTILPVFNIVGRGFIALRVARIFRALRIVRVLRYSDKIQLLLTVLKKEANVLWSVLLLAVFYIFASALIMFNAENSFEDFFDALYWATTALTTVGYGDVCPVTDVGRLISMLSSLFGVAIIALPSGIITAGYMSEIKQAKNK